MEQLIQTDLSFSGEFRVFDQKSNINLQIARRAYILLERMKKGKFVGYVKPDIEGYELQEPKVIATDIFVMLTWYSEPNNILRIIVTEAKYYHYEYILGNSRFIGIFDNQDIRTMWIKASDISYSIWSKKNAGDKK